MTLEELTKLLASNDIHLIRVSDVEDGKGDRHTTMSFVGALDEYIHAIKVLGAKAVFVNTIEVTEEYFVYSPYKRSSPASTWPFPGSGADKEEFDDEEDEYDLCSVKKGLEKYKSRIGEDGCFELLACNVYYNICENWMEELRANREEAIEIINEQLEAEEDERMEIQERLEAEEEERLAHAIQQLHGLVADKKFSSLKTQRAMRAYAIDKIPELEELDDSKLKREIQEIAAKIEAKR